MPIHDWAKTESGVFHDFHHAWIEEIKRNLNSDSLPAEYYAMAEQHAGSFGPDVLTLQVDEPIREAVGGVSERNDGGERNGGGEPVGDSERNDGRGSLLLAPPQVELTAESDLEFYRRKQNIVVVRHVTGDRIVAVVEIVSRGNKSSNLAIRAFVEKAAEFLFHGVHLLVVDLHPPGPRDPRGIHGAIWDELTGQVYAKPQKPLTLAAYESGRAGLSTRAYVQPVAVGDKLPDMPLFLEPGAHVPVHLQATYDRAFAALPRRWRSVLDA